METEHEMFNILTGQPPDNHRTTTGQPQDNHRTTTGQPQDTHGTTTGQPRDNHRTTAGQPLRCRWCNEDYNIITEHWLRHCPAIGYWKELMPASLNEHDAHFDDRETTIAILNSQNAVTYEEITGLLRNFPLPGPNS